MAQEDLSQEYFNREVLTDDTLALQYGEKIDASIHNALQQRGHREAVRATSVLSLIPSNALFPSDTVRRLIAHPSDFITSARITYDNPPSNEASPKTYISNSFELAPIGGFDHILLSSTAGVHKVGGKTVTVDEYNDVVEHIRQTSPLGSSNADVARSSMEVADEIIAQSSAVSIEKSAGFSDITNTGSTFLFGQTAEFQTIRKQGRLQKVQTVASFSARAIIRDLRDKDGLSYDLGFSYRHNISYLDRKVTPPVYMVNGTFRSLDPVLARRRKHEHVERYLNRLNGPNFAHLGNGILASIAHVTEEDSVAVRTK